MSNIVKFFLALILLSGLVLLNTGCGDKPKETQTSKVVSKKIVVKKTAKKPPKKKATKKAKAKPASKTPAKKPTKKSVAQTNIAKTDSNKTVKPLKPSSPPVSPANKQSIPARAKASVNDPSQANQLEPSATLPVPLTMDEKETPATAKPLPAPEPQEDELKLLARAGFYNPKGKIDPFKPLIRDKAVTTAAKKQKRKKRIPLTPLEKIELSQLTLVGVVRASSGNRAIVQEASGKGYIVTEGTFIGTNAGQVEKILPDKVIVEEEVENVTGYIETRRRELRLRKPFGE